METGTKARSKLDKDWRDMLICWLKMEFNLLEQKKMNYEAGSQWYASLGMEAAQSKLWCANVCIHEFYGRCLEHADIKGVCSEEAVIVTAFRCFCFAFYLP